MEFEFSMEKRTKGSLEKCLGCIALVLFVSGFHGASVAKMFTTA